MLIHRQTAIVDVLKIFHARAVSVMVKKQVLPESAFWNVPNRYRYFRVIEQHFLLSNAVHLQ